MILNLTQHAATPEQREAGVLVRPANVAEIISELLTFSSLPTADDILERADELAAYADYQFIGMFPDDRTGRMFAMIGGAPFLMSALENALIERGITPMYAFAKRESTEVMQEDGSVKKITVFKHGGFVTI